MRSPFRWSLVALGFVAIAVGCGGGGDDSPGNNDNGGGKSVVRSPKASFAASGQNKLAYISPDGVVIVDIATGAQKSYGIEDSTQGGVSASTNGLLAVLTEPETTDLIAIKIFDANGNQVNGFEFPFDGFAITGAAISPDGKKVSFGVYERSDEDEYVYARTYIANVDGSSKLFVNTTRYTTEDNETQNFSASPAWTPDNRVVMTTPDGFLITDQALTTVTPIGPGGLAKPSNPVVSPDGRYIVFDQGRGASVGDGDSTFRAIWSFDTQSGTVTQLTRGVIEQYFASFSPDGSVLLFGDSSPFAVGNVGAFERTYLQALPFTQTLVDLSNDDASVRGSDGEIIQLFGRAAWF